MKVASLCHKDGFTLLELMITILIGSIITLATTTVLLLGLRLNNESTNTVIQQNTTRVLLSALEDLATEGTITKVSSTASSWSIVAKVETEEKIIFSYNAKEKIIYTGTKTPLLEGIISSSVTKDGQLLTFAVETEDGIYESSVYCRTAVAVQDDSVGLVKEEVVESNVGNVSSATLTPKEKAARIEFLKTCASQYGSGGVILTGEDFGKYFSQWYIKEGWETTVGNDTWNAKTPWCACFVSWALEQQEEGNIAASVPRYSLVDDFLRYFTLKSETKDNKSKWIKVSEATSSGTTQPLPGDLVIFDWDSDTDETDPQHIGVVLKVEEEEDSDGNGKGTYVVYTIEGNTSNRVAVRSYALNDPEIIGYGQLNWISGEIPEVTE